MSTKVRRVGMICAEPAMLGQLVEPLVRHRHVAHVGLDGAERVVRGLRRRGLRQRVEEGRLADVRQADDAHLEAHAFQLLSCGFFRPFRVQPLASMARWTLF